MSCFKCIEYPNELYEFLSRIAESGRCCIGIVPRTGVCGRMYHCKFLIFSFYSNLTLQLQFLLKCLEEGWDLIFGIYFLLMKLSKRQRRAWLLFQQASQQLYIFRPYIACIFSDVMSYLHLFCRIQALNGRFYGGRTITAETYDGVTKYEVEETEEELKKRLDDWERFISGEDGGE